MKGPTSWCVTVGVVTLVAVAAAGCAQERGVAVGVSTSAAFMDAARLAFADATADGSRLVVDTLMVGEATNEAAPALRAADRFVTDPRVVAVVGHSNSSASLAASQIYNANEVVQIAPHSSATVYSQAGPFSFRLVPPDDRQADFLVAHLEATFPEDARIAIVYVNDDYGRGLRAGVQAGLSGAGRRIVLEVPYVEGHVEDGHIAYAVDAISASRPDLILWLGRASTLSRFLPGIRASRPDLTVIGGDAVATAGQLTPGEGSWSGVGHVDFLDLASTPALREFAARYLERFGRPATAPDVLTYDAVRVILAAVADGARSGPAVREYLASFGNGRPPYEGVAGPITFDPSGDVARSHVMVTIP